VAVLKFKIPEKILKRVEIEAKRRKVSSLEIIQRAIDSYLKDDDVSDEEFLGNIEKMIGESLAAESKDAEDVIEELELELAQESLNRMLLLNAKTQDFQLEVEKELFEELNRVAKDQDIDISEMILIAIELYFDEKQK
jgi:hypothetical protein